MLAALTLPGSDFVTYAVGVSVILGLIWRFVLWPLYKGVEAAPTLMDIAKEFRNGEDGKSTLKDQLGRIETGLELAAAQLAELKAHVDTQGATVKVIERRVDALNRRVRVLAQIIKAPPQHDLLADEVRLMDH